MTETLYRSCPTCEASCGLVLEVDRDARQVISIKGDPNDERSQGYVCAKSQAFRYVYEDPERLRRPVKKVNGEWKSSTLYLSISFFEDPAAKSFAHPWLRSIRSISYSSWSLVLTIPPSIVDN